MKELVSIMMPCLNGEQFVERVFRSLLSQTYTNIEVIFVNDGSVDKTEEIVLSYQERFQEKGMKLKYYYQENKGPAEAINAALPHIKGEYCMWLDADDFIEAEHVERKVRTLEGNPDADVVMCRGVCLHEKDLSYLCTLGDEEPVGTLFEDILLEYRRCTPGLYMVRTKALKECLGGEKICASWHGQNMQLLLPITYEKKAVYLKDRLFNYVVRENSVSHGRNTYYSVKKRWNEITDTKKTVLHAMKNKFSSEYYDKISEAVELKMAICQMNSFFLIPVDKEDAEYIKNILLKWLGKDVREEKRAIYLWGGNERGHIIGRLLNEFLGIQISGYIDNDYINIPGAKAPDEIDPTEKYLIIPLNYYDSVMQQLEGKKYERGDYSYPMETLRRRLEE